MNKTNILVAAFLLLCAATVEAQVSAVNAGFEATALSDGNFTTNTFGGGWMGLSGGNAGVLNPSTSMFTSEAPQGMNVAYSNGRDICQTVGVVENDTFYSTTAMVGVRLDVGSTTLVCGVELRSASGVRCRGEANPAPVDSFAEIGCQFTAGSSDPDNGQSLELCLTTSGVQCNFDTAGGIPVELLSFSVE